MKGPVLFGEAKVTLPAELEVRLKETFGPPPSPVTIGEALPKGSSVAIVKTWEVVPAMRLAGAFTRPILTIGRGMIMTDCVPVLQLTLSTQAAMTGLEFGAA